MGVSMLPRLAAMVCSTTWGTSSRSCPAMRRMVMPKGTKAMRDTSLVMTMLHTKGKNTSRNTRVRVERMRPSSRLAR